MTQNADTILLHKVHALVKGTKARAQRKLTDAHRTSTKAQPLSGIQRTYRPFDDEERSQLPPESTRVQININDVVVDVAGDLARLLDLQLTQDAGNAKATADVAVNGQTIIADAPVTFLLALEKQLVDLRTYFSQLPVLDPAEHWTYDEQLQCWRSDPASTLKMRKVPKNHVRFAGDQHHPPQVEVFNEDVPVGTWTTVKLSGAMTATRVRDLTQRVEELIEAVRVAREQANATLVEQRTAGKAIFDFLLGSRPKHPLERRVGA